MICSLEATSKAPQKPLVIVVHGRYFPVGSGPAHRFIAPQAMPIVFRYGVSAPIICLRPSSPGAQARVMSQVRFLNYPRLRLRRLMCSNNSTLEISQLSNLV